MRIAISGSACQGKTTLVNDFIKNWPIYKKSEESYRKVIKEEKLGINKNVNRDGQWKILNCLVDDMQKSSTEGYVLFDRCPLDNLIYSLWSFEANSSDIDKDFIDKCIPVVKESLKLLDVILFLPVTKVAPVKIELKEDRETDTVFIKEIDNIFKAMERQYMINGGEPFFCKDDKPALIEIFGSPEERIKMIELYLAKNGDLVDEQESVLSNENLDLMESLLYAQKQVKDKEDEENKLYNKFIRK